MAEIELKGVILDIDYVTRDTKSAIRMAFKSGGKIYTVYDTHFPPYFYLIPHNDGLDASSLAKMVIPIEKENVEIAGAEKLTVYSKGRQITVIKVTVNNARHVPKVSEHMREFGECYENDILYWKRYLIDKKVSPLSPVRLIADKDGADLVVREIGNASGADATLSHICFDIETYNPQQAPRPDKDPVLMISYANDGNRGVLTTKKIAKSFVKVYENEAQLINAFQELVKSLDADAIVGYNSSNFDIPYLLERAKTLGIEFTLSRYGDETRKEPHGLIEFVKMPGRINVDIYNVVKFISIVGASEKLIRVNSFKLGEIYEAVTGSNKKMVEKQNIWQMWDGSDEERNTLAEYSLDDSISLDELYNFFIPLEVEVAKITGTTLGEACISTTGQLVEYLLMRHAKLSNELIPNKPDIEEIDTRLENPIVGAYVKTPEAGIYDNIAVFDFRGLYPSIIITYNIDPGTLAQGDEEAFVAPDGTRFRKDRPGITPTVLRMLINERAEVKKAYKKDPDNKALAARSSALKVIANSFYGYLGYARSRWYSRASAAAVTAFGRSYIAKTMDEAEKSGFKVLYGDTDSIFLLMEGRGKDDVLAFLKKMNGILPETMELELEDFYTRGVFVGKRGASENGTGAKKKYALLSEHGRIKIRGFELVRRDWSFVARNTQKRVLETILKDGSKEKAVKIVKDVISDLRGGNVPIKDLTIFTQIRKKLSAYDIISPEVSAAKKAIERKQKKREDLEFAVIGYVVTKSGSSISDKAELAEFAQDYDPEYYIQRQVVPATMKILKELGVSEEELRNVGSQKRLM